MNNLKGICLSSFLLLSIAQISNAQTENEPTLILEEVLITAQRRVSDLQTTPISVSAFGESDIERLQIVESTDRNSYLH